MNSADQMADIREDRAASRYLAATGDVRRAYEVARGERTETGLLFDWWLVNADGAGFELRPDSRYHALADVRSAKAWLRANRDVVGTIRVRWGTWETEPFPVSRTA